jgi:eukaryotic-like serine/threonine-protein kinase
MPLSSGTRLGAYEVVSIIGAGGMGEVYRARDTNLDRDVAIKTLPESFAMDADRLARFEREAKTLALLNHPHIAQIYGIEASAIVMELVEGEDLSALIARGAMPLGDVLPIAKQIAAALGAAHEQGIVHRDLKPANIKIKVDGTVKVLDFGLAKAMDPAGASSVEAMHSPTLTARATQMGVIIGTAPYMAPEQAKGKAVDRRADIWAFGVVLFEMLAGERAFKGEDVSDVLAAVLRQEIDWKALPADTPKHVRRVLERCIERDPKKRFHDIADVWIDLDTPEGPAPAAAAVHAPAQGSRLARALPWIAAIVVAAGALGWSHLRTPAPEPAQVIRASTTMKDLSVFVDVASDGTRLAYASATTIGSATGIMLRTLDQFEGTLVSGTENGAYPLFSPDGQSILFNDFSDGWIKKIGITGGTAIRLCEGSLGGGAAWGTDNTIVFRGSKGLMRVSSDGGTPEQFTTVDTANGETSHSHPQFLPGGRHLVFTVSGKDGLMFAVRDLDKPGHHVVARGGYNGKYAESGHLLYVRDRTLFAAPFDLARLAVTGSEVGVVEDISRFGPAGTADYSVSRTGLLAYFSEGGAQGTTLAWADRTGKSTPLPGQSRQSWGTGRLSPDGRFVANGITDKAGVRDLWTFDVERSTLTRLTYGAAGDSNDFPIWSPDSRLVFYANKSSGKYALYSIPADASSRTPTMVLAADGPVAPTSITPDGKTLLFQMGGTTKPVQNYRIEIPANGPGVNPEPLHDATGTESAAAISPDDKWVAYVSNESNANEVYVLPFPGPGAKIRVSLDGGDAPRWTKDGRELLYWANVPTSKLMVVEVTTSPSFHAGQPRELFRQPKTTTWDVTPDKNRFLVELSQRQTVSTLNIVTNWFDELRRKAPARK